MRDVLGLVRALATHNNIQTLKLLLCNKQMLQEISKCSKLTVLEIVEASVKMKNPLRKYLKHFEHFSCCETRTWPHSPRGQCVTTSLC